MVHVLRVSGLPGRAMVWARPTREGDIVFYVDRAFTTGANGIAVLWKGQGEIDK